MNITQPRVHWKRLFEVPALPGWSLLGWKLASALSTLDFVRINWHFLESPAGNILLIVAGIGWLFLVMSWPSKKSSISEIANHLAPIDPRPLVDAEADTRANAVQAIYTELYKHVGEINRSLNELKVKPPESTLKQRTAQLANDLFDLLKMQGSEPPSPLSRQFKTEDEQKLAMKVYFDWKWQLYYKYMAYFRDRVVKNDLELSIANINTALEYEEIDPPRANKEVDVKKIAETLLLTASHMLK